MNTIDIEIAKNAEEKYYKDGNVWIVLPYKKGSLDGILKQYHPNGNIHSTIPFSNGSPHGLARSYNENGEIKKQILWYEGKIKNRELAHP